MGILEAIFLGLIQGLTEFLPVSSSGHIELGKAILGEKMADDSSSLFTIIVHGATALSTIIVFRKDIEKILRDLFTFRYTDSTNLLLFIIISMIPAALVGFFLEEELDKLFNGNILLVGCMLLVTAAILYTTTIIQPKRGILNFKNAFLIGLAQAFAILPGVSRSGSTIATGLMLGINKKRMARFSFLMVLPLIFGIMSKKLMDYDAQAEGTIEPVVLLAGFAAAFISGLFACQWMVYLVRKSKLHYFAIYCAIVGIIAIITSFLK